MPVRSGESPSSSAEQTIPAESMPRRVAASMVRPPGSRPPGRMYGTCAPTYRLGAPVTTVTVPWLPTSSFATYRLSALGCGSSATTLATLIPSHAVPTSITSSTSVPDMFRRWTSSSSGSVMSTSSRSQLNGTFMR